MSSPGYLFFLYLFRWGHLYHVLKPTLGVLLSQNKKHRYTFVHSLLQCIYHSISINHASWRRLTMEFPPPHMVAYSFPLLILQLPPQDPPFCQALCIYDTRLRYVLLFYSVFIITMKLMKHHKIWPPTPIYFLVMFIIFQAVRDFILSQPGKFISYLAIHSYGSKIVYPWSSTEEKVLTINKRTLNSL